MVMRLGLVFLSLFIVTAGTASGAAKVKAKEYAIVTCAEECGMFRTAASLLGMLHLYESGMYAGLKVDFGLNGPYYDSDYGPNWWEYYFQPIRLGKETNTIPFYTINGPAGSDCAMFTEFCLTRQEANQLIQKYIKLKLPLKNKIDHFVDTHFDDCYIIGVHYRGTDKWVEALRAEYATMTSHILEAMRMYNKPNFKIFIATDEQAFLDHMKSCFPTQVIYYEDAIRSSNDKPIHKTLVDCYKKGEDAVIDCILLSRCNILIKTSSNLSLFSTYFNPTMPVDHVTARPYTTPVK